MLYFIISYVTEMCGMAESSWAVEVRRWTYLVVGVFFFKSGYLDRPTDEATGTFLRRKALRLLMPYIVWGLVGTVVYFGFLHFFPEVTQSQRDAVRWEHTLTTSRWYGNPPLWFLTSLFATLALARPMQRLGRLSAVAVLLPAASWALAQMDNPLWMNLNNVFVGVYLYFLGRWWKALEQHTAPHLFVACSGGLLMLALLSNYFWHGEYAMGDNLWSGNPLTAILNASMTICGLMGILSKTITQRVPVLGYIGEHSLAFLVLPYPMIHYYNFVHLTGKRTMINHWNDFIVVTVVVVCLCAWLAKYEGIWELRIGKLKN
ncbi:MAG: acyltransferase [Bacteroidaceae bacterium]|nr:acyltransferase [Bacteroidaceae bacterium]